MLLVAGVIKDKKSRDKSVQTNAVFRMRSRLWELEFWPQNGRARIEMERAKLGHHSTVKNLG